MKALSGLNPVLGPDTSITAGNASQLSDGSSASILMEAKEAERRGLAPMGRYVGMAVAGTEPDEMGIGPIDAVNKLLKRFDLKVDDIGLWELNEAFAVQVLYSAEQLGIPEDRLNVDGGADLDRPPLRNVRRTDHRPRPDRRQAPRREACRRHHVRRRRHGRGGLVRSALMLKSHAFWLMLLQ